MGYEAYKKQENNNVDVKAGQFFEQAVFKGCINDDVNAVREYIGYKDSLGWVKEHQPKKDYNNPETLDSVQLSKLKNAISLKLPNIDEVLRFYTAIGSPLDILHGVDGVFELGDNIVTVDLTLDPNKVIAKADVIILADSEMGMTGEVIEKASSLIVEKFKEEIAKSKKLH